MPSDVVYGENGGGLLDWDEHLLLSPNQEHWFTTTSTSASASASNPAANSKLNLPSPSSNLQNLYSDISPDDLSNPAAVATTANQPDNAFFNQSHQTFEFDTYQGQHWSDLPSQDHANPLAKAVPVNGGQDTTTHLALVESPLDITGPTGELQSQSGSEKGRQQDFAISRALLSPSQSVISSKSQATDLAKPQREKRQSREGLSQNSKSTKLSMTTVSSHNSPNPGQGHVDRRKPPTSYTGPKSSSLNRMISRSALEAHDDEDSRRNQLGIYVRGGSVVSSASGHSRSDNAFHKSDTLDDEFASNTSRRSENKGAGKTPGVLRTRHGEEIPNGQHILPHTKGFSIQIGSEVFKLSGASIMSDGQHIPMQWSFLVSILLRILEHPLTSQSFSKNKCNMMMVPVVLKHCLSIEIR